MKNFKKHISIVVLICIGFLLIPNSTYACVKSAPKAVQNSFSKNQFQKANFKDCCKTKSCNRDKNHSGCSGKCKHSSCKCSTSSSSLSLPTPYYIKNENQFVELKQQKFDFKQAYYSSGYSSIWQPPKIS